MNLDEQKVIRKVKAHFKRKWLLSRDEWEFILEKVKWGKERSMVKNLI